MSRRRPGAGRLLAGGYALFVVAAGGRSAVELVERATAPRVLSALAAAVYATGLVLVVLCDRAHAGTHPGRLHRTAIACASLELCGVVCVGVASLVTSTLSDTVWTRFGAGYLFVPLVLPAGMLAWLLSEGPRRVEGRVNAPARPRAPR